MWSARYDNLCTGTAWVPLPPRMFLLISPLLSFFLPVDREVVVACVVLVEVFLAGVIICMGETGFDYCMQSCSIIRAFTIFCWGSFRDVFATKEYLTSCLWEEAAWLLICYNTPVDPLCWDIIVPVGGKIKLVFLTTLLSLLLSLLLTFGWGTLLLSRWWCSSSLVNFPFVLSPLLF